MSGSGSNSDSAKQKQAALLRTWLTHCKNLETRIPCGAGVCAEYAIRRVLELDKSPKDPGIRQATKVLMEIVTRTLSPYKDKAPVGRKDVLQFGLDTFRKADGLDRSGRRDSITRKLYYNAWEFLNLVHWLAKEDPMESDSLPEDLQEKIRYAMWRATELWKAEKEKREPCPPPLKDEDVEKELNEFLDDAEQSTDEEEDELLEEDDVITQGAALRNYAVGDTVLYSKDARAHNKLYATIKDIVWNEKENVQEYMITCENGPSVKTRNEFLAPCIAVGDKTVLESGSAATIENVYDSHWPPRYLVVKDSGGLEEVQDEEMYKPRVPQEKKSSVPRGNASPSFSPSYSSSSYEDEINIEEREEGRAVREVFKADLHNQVDAAHTRSDHDPSSSDDDIDQADCMQNRPNVIDSVSVSKASERPARHTAAPAPQRPVRARYNTDIESMCKAEKLTKSALSAISFGDAATAVKFLSEALQTIDINSK